MRILTLRYFKLPLIVLKPFDHLAIESVLYQIFLTTTALWSDHAPLTKFDLRFWVQAEELLEHSVMFPGSSKSLNSPVLGVPVALFRLAMQAKQACQHPERYAGSTLERLRSEVEEWENAILNNQSIDPLAQGEFFSRQQAYYEEASYLYVLVVSLLLEQACKQSEYDIQPTPHQNHLPKAVPRHTWQIQKALRILRALEFDNNWISCYIGNWPVYTLGFCLTDAQDIDLVRGEMDRRWESTKSMQIPRFHDDLKSVWRERGQLSVTTHKIAVNGAGTSISEPGCDEVLNVD
jgi:hypothetical protein